MLTFYVEYSNFSISPLVVAKLEKKIFLNAQPPVAQLDIETQPNLSKPANHVDENEIPTPPVAKLDTASRTELFFPEKQVNIKQIGQLPVSQLQRPEYQMELIALTGWAHHIILIQKQG